MRPTTSVPTVSARLAMPLVGEFRRRGYDVDALLGRLGLEESRLSLLVGRLPMDAWSDLCAACIAETGDDAFPLHAARRIARNAFPLEFYLVGSQLNVREGMAFAQPFIGSVVDGFTTVIGMRGPEATAHFTLSGEPLGPPRFAEYFLATLWGFVRTIAPPSPPPRSVSFCHRWPRHGEGLEEIFGAPIRFGMPNVGFTFEPPNVEIPIVGADPELGRLLAEQAASLLLARDMESRLRDRAKFWLADHLSGEEAIGSRLALAMRMSERSLRRKLREEGTSLREMVDDVRQELALKLLEEHPGNLEAVASELGFSSGSAFGRAFRRWTGMTPSEYSHRHEDG